jgi:hypothetical protein
LEYRHQDSNYTNSTNHWRVIAGIGIPLIVLAAAFLLWRYDPTSTKTGVISLFCPFNKLTGLYCPGCGTTRALHALLHLDLGLAIRDNAVFVLLAGPVIAYMAVGEYLHFITGRVLLSPVKVPKWMLYTLLALLLLFTVLRNIPVFPFFYLAPTL